MPVIEAQRASILVLYDHRHINQMRIFAPTGPLHKNTVVLLALDHNRGRPSGQPRECVGRKPRAYPPI
jgi:hypothetical protein